MGAAHQGAHHPSLPRSIICRGVEVSLSETKDKVQNKNILQFRAIMMILPVSIMPSWRVSCMGRIQSDWQKRFLTITLKLNDLPLINIEGPPLEDS